MFAQWLTLQKRAFLCWLRVAHAFFWQVQREAEAVGQAFFYPFFFFFLASLLGMRTI